MQSVWSLGGFKQCMIVNVFVVVFSCVDFQVLFGSHNF